MEKQKLFEELEEELKVSITYNEHEELAQVISKCGNTAIFIGIPLSEQIRAEDPEEEIKKKVRRVVNGNRNEQIRAFKERRNDHARGCGAGADTTGTDAAGRLAYRRKNDNTVMPGGCGKRNQRSNQKGARPVSKTHRKPRAREQKSQRNDPSIKDAVIVSLTIFAGWLTYSGATMLTNLDPDPFKGCLFLSIGLTWILLFAIANSDLGQIISEDIEILKEAITWFRN